MGTYRTDVGSFIKAYVRHKEKMKNMYGIEYEAPNEDALMYLDCQPAYMNNNLVSLYGRSRISVVNLFVNTKSMIQLVLS